MGGESPLGNIGSVSKSSDWGTLSLGSGGIGGIGGIGGVGEGKFLGKGEGAAGSPGNTTPLFMRW